MSKELKEGGTECAFGPDDLEILDVAYQSALARLMLLDPEKVETVKVFLRQRVIQIAKYGVRDPNTLAELALDMLPKERRQNPGVRKRSSAIPRRIFQAS
jgi:hypothetical protein